MAAERASTALRVLHATRRLRRHQGVGFAAAVVSVGAATLIQWLARDQYAGTPFLTIYPAVILTTLVGGLGAGFLAALLSAVSQWSLFIANFHWFALATYGCDAILCVTLIEFINRTMDMLLISVEHEKRAKQRQHLLAKELQHRIQNLFTVVQAVVRLSLPGDELIRASVVKQRLTDRLQSMSAANRTITDSMGDGVPLIDLLDSEIRGLESRFEISGATGLVLTSQMAQNIALVLHELVTNALKYGALSFPEGRVILQLEWMSGTLTFTWEERGGPPLSVPTNQGFGTQVLATFAKGFSQRVDICYSENGLRYVLQICSDQIGPPEYVATEASGAAAAGGEIAHGARLSRSSFAPFGTEG